VPAGEQPPLILDMATAGRQPEEQFAEMQGTFFKMLGFGLVCHALGGIVAGMVTQEEAGPRRWEGVNQGAFFLVIDLGQLIDPATHRRQMDDFIAGLRQMQPAPGLERADAPGGLEHEYERVWLQEGIPVGEDHQGALQRAATDLGLDTPW
jgi:LDH2 family malate/lactate/ureidoglycolate dehydrogenase